MAVDIVMPQMGESIFEGTITKWLKKPGDKVERDEPLFEISTDKVDAEIPSPSAGVLKEIKVGEGQTVPIQTVVGVIDAAGSAVAAPAPAPATAPAKSQPTAPAKAPAPVPRPSAPAPVAVASAPAVSAPGSSGERIHSSPLVRRMAKEHGIDLAAVQGTGAGGRISKQDIEAVIVAAGEAAVAGLRAFPTMNASLDGTNVVLHKDINIGIAVALDWGLLVPVVKNADEKNLLGIQRAMNDLAERARSKKLKPEEVQESTFSITNPGVFGGLFGLPVISQPNVGILGLGAIEKRPVVINDSIAIRAMCYVTLSYDHRVVDGAIAHQFLHKVKETLENWNEPVL